MSPFSVVSRRQSNTESPNLLNVHQSEFHLFQYVVLNERIKIDTLLNEICHRSRRNSSKTVGEARTSLLRFSFYMCRLEEMKVQTNSPQPGN